MTKITLFGASITDKEVSYVAEAVEYGWLEKANTYQSKFEDAFKLHVGRHHAIAVPCCTHAIHLALLSLGIGPGDEVIVPDCTWIASASPVVQIGAIPVFADIDPGHWCLNSDNIKRAISTKTKAVIVVDLYGNMPDYKAIVSLAKEHNIFVIEDAAQSIGSTYFSKSAGGFGDISVFSFHGTKTLTTGEGGMLVTDDENIYKHARMLSDHGRWPGENRTQNEYVAYKYKMSSMQAAMGLAQLERLHELVSLKKRIFSWYQDRLSGQPNVSLNQLPTNTTSSYWMPTIVWDRGLKRKPKQINEFLARHSIESRPFFKPLSQQPAFTEHPATFRCTDNPCALDISDRAINLPSPLSMSEAQASRVCEVLFQSLRP